MQTYRYETLTPHRSALLHLETSSINRGRGVGEAPRNTIVHGQRRETEIGIS